jgi:hypothetical protein
MAEQSMRPSMEIKLPEVDMRRDGGSRSINDENGNLIGQILMAKDVGRTIILFGKYRGDFKTQQECQAFADGVTSVLNHITKME